jgi:SAM-dependent methyltransferase
MKHCVRFDPPGEEGDIRRVSEIGAVQGHPAEQILDARQARRLAHDDVHVVRFGNEPPNKGGAEESGAASDENRPGHRSRSLRRDTIFMSMPEHIASSESIYRAADYARAFPPAYHRHFWHQARLAVVRRQLARLRPIRAVLDVGCGPGQYVRALRQSGYEAFGCDPGDPWVDGDLAGEVFRRTTPDALPDDVRSAVDVVLLLDVLEHLPDPMPMLASLACTLPHARFAIITVPARPELWSALDRQAGHHRRYALKELSALVAVAGLTVIDVRYVFTALYPLAWLGRRRASARSIRPPDHPALHALAGRLLALEARVLPAAVPGTSALCVARFNRSLDRRSS